MIRNCAFLAMQHAPRGAGCGCALDVLEDVLRMALRTNAGLRSCFAIASHRGDHIQESNLLKQSSTLKHTMACRVWETVSIIILITDNSDNSSGQVQGQSEWLVQKTQLARAFTKHQIQSCREFRDADLRNLLSLTRVSSFLLCSP